MPFRPRILRCSSPCCHDQPALLNHEENYVSIECMQILCLPTLHPHYFSLRPTRILLSPLTIPSTYPHCLPLFLPLVTLSPFAFSLRTHPNSLPFSLPLYSPTLSALSMSQMLTLKSSYPASRSRPDRDGAREVTPHMMPESW